MIGFRSPRDSRTERAIWVMVALSLLVHALVLLGLPRMRLPSLEQSELSDASRSLSVSLVPVPPPPVPPAFVGPPPGAKLPGPPPAARRTRPAPPPVIARKPPLPAPDIPAPGRPVEGDDLWSYIEDKRRARAASTPAAAPVPSAPSAPKAEDDDARRDRIAAANLASSRAPAFGYDPRVRRGSFQLQRVGFDYAEFMFYGWDKDARRNMARLIEVSKGANSDIRIAVVRRIIAIIREHEEGDFLWESQRLRRNLMLSARAGDNARLEDFMLLEFFGGPFPAR